MDNSPSGVQANNHATVLKATWRGITGLWGNIYQMCDGFRCGVGTDGLRLDMGKGLVQTAIKNTGGGSGFWPDKMIKGRGTGWNADHLFIGDYSAKASGETTAAFPDQQWIYSNYSSDLVLYVGGHCSHAGSAGLFFLYCYNYAAFSDGNVGGRLAKW